jgi:hypothetical protein
VSSWYSTATRHFRSQGSRLLTTGTAYFWQTRLSRMRVMYVRTYVCTYVCTYGCMYVCMWICVCVDACMCVHVCARMRTYVHNLSGLNCRSLGSAKFGFLGSLYVLKNICWNCSLFCASLPFSCIQPERSNWAACFCYWTTSAMEILKLWLVDLKTCWHDQIA